MSSKPTFNAWTTIRDDVEVKVKVDDNGSEPAGVYFTLPDYTELPGLYLGPARARELRDGLTAALIEFEVAILAAAGAQVDAPHTQAPTAPSITTAS